MVKDSAPALPSPPHAAASEAEVRYVARTPILNLHGRVHGYQLLSRVQEPLINSDGRMAARAILDDTVLFGLERLAGGLPAFVRCSSESLTEQLVEVLPPGMTVLEIPDAIDPNPEVIAACKRLKSQGFRIALENFAWQPSQAPLVELADYIKVDFENCHVKGRKELIKALKNLSVSKVATNVETQEQYKKASAEGFTLFQGHFFCAPELLQNAKIPANRLCHLEILKHLYQNPIDLQKVSVLVMRDISLSYRLLKLVNSPFCAMRQEVRSIESALMVVGEAAFKRIATLAILSEMNAGRPSEVLQMALTRARFCETAAIECNLDPGEQYLLGMLSLLPAMLRVPMETLAPSLPLRDAIRDALLGRPLPERCLLQWLEFNERADWSACDAIAGVNSLNQRLLAQRYADAIQWNQTAMELAG